MTSILTHIDDAKALDDADDLNEYRNEFHFPKTDKGHDALYFCGHSLGLQPKQTNSYVNEVLDAWEKFGVKGHFEGERPWLPYHELLTEQLAGLVGAKENEVISMQTLSANLHLLMVSFYKPTRDKYKILIENHAFPSDRYAVQSQAMFHGFEPQDAVITLNNDPHRYISTEEIIATIDKHADELALILLPGVQYYSGQVYDMEKLTKHAHSKGISIGFDLAHAVGNLELQLHDWQVDFAVWCHYKYVNSGPGAIGGAFVHENNLKKNLVHFAGWWGHDKASRFQMPEMYQPIQNSVEAWQLSNPPILSMAAVLSSLDLFKQVGYMAPLREKSIRLTNALADTLQAEFADDVHIISDAPERGAQLSLRLLKGGEDSYQALLNEGVICDWRAPNVMRIAPVPFYNSFQDIYLFVDTLKRVLSE